MQIRFVGLGKKIYLFEKDRATKFRQVLWGDFLSVESEEPACRRPHHVQGRHAIRRPDLLGKALAVFE